MQNDCAATPACGDPEETLAGMAAKALRGEPTRRAIEFDRSWITVGELRVAAEGVARLIRRSGVDPRAPIALAPRNRPSAVAALMSLISDARNIRMVYAHQSGASLARNLAHLGASILIAAAEDFSPEVVQQLRKDGCAGIGLTELGADFASGLDCAVREIEPGAAAEPCLEILTSGTTGPPKLWPLSYKLLEKRLIAANVAYGKGRKSDRAPTLVYYPLGNISGLYSVLPQMLAGEAITLHDRFSVGGWHDFVMRYRPSEIYLPVVGMRMVLDAGIAPEDLACAKFLRSGMTTVPIELQREFEDRYNMPVLLSYGATEFGGVIVQMTLDMVSEWGRRKLGSAGRPVDGAELRVVNPDTGALAPAGEHGVLEVLVPAVSPEWKRTSDIGRIDDDGFVFITGRADGAIMRGGFKLLPETIEVALMEHPDVRAAAVVGVEDRRLGQVPVAVIELREHCREPSAAELEEHLRQRVPATHIPVEYRVVAELPRTGSLKVARHAVKALLAASA